MKAGVFLGFTGCSHQTQVINQIIAALSRKTAWITEIVKPATSSHTAEKQQYSNYNKGKKCKDEDEGQLASAATML